MAARITLDRLRDAHAAHDPRFTDLLTELVNQPDPDEPPKREGVYTFDDFLAEQQAPAFKRKSLDERAQVRMAKLKALEADDAEVPLPDRLRCHDVLIDLWKADDLFSRECLLRVIAEVPLVYGPFKALKRIFKESEAADDTEVYGALCARFDVAFAERSHRVSRRTLGYLVRRGWRYLRRIGQTFPAIYPDVATDYLIHYRSYGHSLSRSWILNHIFFHEMGVHARTRFKFDWETRRPNSLRKYRAFDDLWRRSPRPLFTLLERAELGEVIEYAVASLKADFRAQLREVEPAWVARLIHARKHTVDDFVVWILDNVPRFEQSKFRELGLHEAVLLLFQSDSYKAREYAVTYARTYARDLPVPRLIQLANSEDDDVRKLAVDLLQSRDPRKEVGLDAWGELLTTELGSEIAVEALRKHFGASELTPEWFVPLLTSSSGEAREFAEKHLLQLHPREQLSFPYFVAIIEQLDGREWEHSITATYCCDQIEKLGVDEMPQESLQRLLLHPVVREFVVGWVSEGKLKASAFGADFLKTVAFRPSFEADRLIADLKQTAWGKHGLQYDESLAETIFGWLYDVRQFLPGDLGFEWLLQLVQRAEPLYHDFAVETLSKSFLPADFATDQPDQAAAEEETGDEINVDLGGDTFVFTGKLATMTRAEAQKKVTAAGGANSKSVTKKLDYLVIGDEGSPLYGQGRKGSKQTKAEKLNEEEAGIRIISETAFLQMLAGEQREFSADAVQAGCERLWSMMCDGDKPDAPLPRFARRYLRLHHPDICLAETDRPVDPGAEIPPEFLTFDRLLPLFSDSRAPLRSFALEIAGWEFARWAPPIEGIVEMCESPYPEVRDFVATAMTTDDSPEHRRYRVDSKVLTADAVYSFCESRNAETRKLGLKLIDMHERLRVPGELFRLTESPDGNVRTFVIRAFWSLYRERGITADWKPAPPAESTLKKKRKQPIEEIIGTGAPARPENPPAKSESMRALLRRILFELPPGRPPKKAKSAGDDIVKLKLLPARLAKLNLIDTLRDLAIEDIEFAWHVFPLLREFQRSRGKSEHAACLVAVTRIAHHHPEFRDPAARSD